MIYEFGKGKLRVGLFLVNDKPSVVIDRMPPGEIGEFGKPVADEHQLPLGNRVLLPTETVLSFDDEATAVAVYDAVFKRDESSKLRKALEFYAGCDRNDCGDVAREALGYETR